MDTLKFKTSLKCGGCVKAITPGLNALTEIETWNVDLENPDKILEVTANEDISDKIEESIKKAGYQITRL